MSDIMKSKLEVFREVEPILDLLREVHERLDAIPRSTVAARQLHLIISRLAGWKTAYEPLQGQKADTPILQVIPSRQEMDAALKAYRRQGYFGLTDREKQCIEAFDRQYRQKQA